jgi:hypothetical protein
MKQLMILFAAAVLLLSPAGVAFAHNGEEDSPQHSYNDKRQEIKEKLETKQQEAREKFEAKKAEITEKLSAKRLELCQARESKINEINDRYNDRAQGFIAKLDGANEKLNSIYEKYNLDVANYETLTNDIAEKRQAAVDALATVSAADFNCEEEGVNRQFGQYIKTNLRTSHDAIKTYRDSIKELAKQLRAAAQESATANETTESEQAN